MKGPASRTAYDPDVLVAYLDQHGVLVSDGHPVRCRHFINGIPVYVNDARTIRRWRNGHTEGVTLSAASALLERYGLTLHTFETWAIAQNRSAVKRGQLSLPVTNQPE